MSSAKGFRLLLKFLLSFKSNVCVTDAEKPNKFCFPAANSIFGLVHKTQQELDLTLKCHIVAAHPALSLHRPGQLIKH